jgi:hypothetical protein
MISKKLTNMTAAEVRDSVRFPSRLMHDAAPIAYAKF